MKCVKPSLADASIVTVSLPYLIYGLVPSLCVQAAEFVNPPNPLRVVRGSGAVGGLPIVRTGSAGGKDLLRRLEAVPFRKPGGIHKSVNPSASDTTAATQAVG